MFFLVAAGIMFLNAIFQIILSKNAFAIYYLDWCKNPDFIRKRKTIIMNSPNISERDKREYGLLETNLSQKSIAEEPISETFTSWYASAKRNFSNTQGLLYAMMWVFVLTFTVFPGAMDTTYYKFMSGMHNEVSWFFLLNSTIFNVFDTVGRKAGGSPRFNWANKVIIGISASRIVFLATFLLVAFQVGPVWLFNSDWFKISNIIIFSVTNGFVATLTAVKAP